MQDGKIKIIIDTDLGFDCDDAGALAVANILHKKSEIEVLAITHSVNRKEGCAAIKAINEYYGNDVPVGIAENYAFNVDEFYENFYAKMRFNPNFSGFAEKPSFYRLLDCVIKRGSVKENLTSAKKLIAEKLSVQEDNSVIFLEIGQMNNIADMLTEGDSGFGTSYRTLFKRKVKKIVAMCGNFEQKGEFYDDGSVFWQGEFNVLMDIKSCRKVFSEKDLPVDVLDFNQGKDVLTGSGLEGQTNNPVYKIYRKCGNGKECESWDIVSLIYAAQKCTEMFLISDYGKVKIDDKGRSLFSTGNGKHRLIKLKGEKTLSNKINAFLAKR